MVATVRPVGGKPPKLLLRLCARASRGHQLASRKGHRPDGRLQHLASSAQRLTDRTIGNIGDLPSAQELGRARGTSTGGQGELERRSTWTSSSTSRRPSCCKSGPAATRLPGDQRQRGASRRRCVSSSTASRGGWSCDLVAEGTGERRTSERAALKNVKGSSVPEFKWRVRPGRASSFTSTSAAREGARSLRCAREEGRAPIWASRFCEELACLSDGCRRARAPALSATLAGRRPVRAIRCAPFVYVAPKDPRPGAQSRPARP